MSALLVAALLVLADGEMVESVGHALGLNSGVLAAGKVSQWTIVLAFVVFAFALIYHFAPDVKERHWYWITLGSVVGVLIGRDCFCWPAR